MRPFVAQLLWLEFVLKLLAGLLLCMAPRLTIKGLGLPGTSHETAFWQRLLGALLIGIAGASLMQGWSAGSTGLGLAGSAVINGCLAIMILLALAFDRATIAPRGRLLLALLALVLALVGMIEAAIAGSASVPQ